MVFTQKISSVTSYSLSSHVNPNIATYRWRIGSLLVPQRPVTLFNAKTISCFAERYEECIRAMHLLNKALYGSSIGSTQYQVVDAADTAVEDGKTYDDVIAVQATVDSYKNGFIICQE